MDHKNFFQKLWLFLHIFKMFSEIRLIYKEGSKQSTFCLSTLCQDVEPNQNRITCNIANNFSCMQIYKRKQLQNSSSRFQVVKLLEGWYTYPMTLKMVLFQITFKTLSALDLSDLKKGKILSVPGILYYNLKYTKKKCLGFFSTILAVS